jgi:hypothetical protein
VTGKQTNNCISKIDYSFIAAADILVIVWQLCIQCHVSFFLIKFAAVAAAADAFEALDASSVITKFARCTFIIEFRC